uniref:Ataxin-2 C-terminal domain-containing protein n=1 Tax=Salix viminalis TaxID=40686 RepID=A0A6N2N2U8_SALVM
MLYLVILTVILQSQTVNTVEGRLLEEPLLLVLFVLVFLLLPNPMLDAPSEPHCSSSENSTGVVSPQISESNRSSKAFKLNPGAKKFSPSFSNPSSVNAATVPIVASMAYIPSNSPVVPVASVQPELGIPFAPRSSVPAKFPPYSNLTAVNGGNGSQFSQPVAGHMETRMQPLRHAGQYHAVQAASSYAPPNSQSVMVRRLGQVVYVQPVTHDLVPSPAAISTVSARPLLTPYQVQYPKHQGGAAGQTMQFCVAPSFVSGQQPFAVPSHIPFLQPPIPFQFQDLILSSAPSFHEHTPQ